MGETTIDKGPPKDMGLTGMGRADLERIVTTLQKELADARAANVLLESAVVDADSATARALHRRNEMHDNLTVVQEHCSRQLAELRLLREREGGMFAHLAAHMTRGRSKYPNGCTLLALLDECGEVAHAINKGKGVGRAREELLDLAGVAMRLYAGEVDHGLVVEGLAQRRVEK